MVLKSLTHDELKKAPGIIIFLHMASYSKICVGEDLIRKAQEDYPEYFEKSKFEKLPVREQFKLMAKYQHETYLYLTGQICDPPKFEL